MRCLTTVETGLQRVEVWSNGREGRASEVEFRVQGAVHAWWHRDYFLTGLAWDNICAGCLLRPAGPPQTVLMLGLAGGTSLRALKHLVGNVHVTAVDFDPTLVELARKFMDLDSLGATIHVTDAYEFVRGYRGPPFDVVVDDVYQALDHDVARPGAWSSETLATVHRLVAPGGVLAVNLVTGQGHRAMQSEFRRLFRGAWPKTRSVTTPQGMNETLVGGEAVCSGQALKKWRLHWPGYRDRKLWDRLKVRGI